MSIGPVVCRSSRWRGLCTRSTRGESIMPATFCEIARSPIHRRDVHLRRASESRHIRAALRARRTRGGTGAAAAVVTPIMPRGHCHALFAAPLFVRWGFRRPPCRHDAHRDRFAGLFIGAIFAARNGSHGDSVTHRRRLRPREHGVHVRRPRRRQLAPARRRDRHDPLLPLDRRIARGWLRRTVQHPRRARSREDPCRRHTPASSDPRKFESPPAPN